MWILGEHLLNKHFIVIVSINFLVKDNDKILIKRYLKLDSSNKILQINANHNNDKIE